jgi:uncharacterized protein (TIGR02569 family)
MSYRARVSVEAPPRSVLRAFGAAEPPRLLAGGQGISWVAGGLVLKPGGGPVHAWWGEALDDVTAVGFRLATPVRTLHGTWSWEGWSATRWVDGAGPDRTDPSTWVQVVDAARAFHQAVAHLPRPGCIHVRDDRWAVADRAAWGEGALRIHPTLTDLWARLRPAVQPLGAAQVVHGDLAGNVLLSPGLPPAIIDVSPYWRPPAYAEGVVMADALCWHGAPASLLDRTGVPVTAVARALLFRIATTSQAASVRGARVDLEDEARRYDRATRALGL